MQKIHLTLTFFVSELTDDVFLPTNIRIGANGEICTQLIRHYECRSYLYQTC